MSKTLKTILIAAAAVVVAGGVALALLLPKRDMPGHGNIADIDWYDESGTEFVIENVDMLYDVVTLSYHYDFAGQTLKLGADITVNEGDAADWETKAPKWSWAPIRDFAGTFDGQGHTISGIYAKTLNETTALFTHVKSSAVIRDFRLENALFLTSGAVGSASIAADCAGTYQRIYSNAVVRCNYGAAGGLFSRQSGKLTAEECWFDGVVETSHRNIGGIADQADGAEMVLSHCLNTGKIIDTWHIGANNAGGLVGMTVNSARLVIDDCFTSGALELGSQHRSGSVLGGGDATGNATIMNTFCVLETCDYPVSELITNKVGGPIAVMEKNLRGIKAYQWTNLDFENYWACEDGSFPVLKCFAKQPLDTAGVVREVDYDWYDETAQELVITNLPQLYAFTLLSGNTDYASQTVKLAVDLALNDGLAENWIETAPENRWYPVQWFAGTFDGQGHTLSGIYVKGPNAQGLFGRTKGTAVLKNFRLENSLIHATADSPTNLNFAGSGTVVGRGGGTLDTIYSNAIVYAEGMQIGGIIGQVNLRGMITTINNCWFDGKAITKGEEYGYQVGGIVGGQALGTVNMTHCLNTGFLHTEVNKGSVAGGFVGTVMNDSVMNIGDCLNAGILDTANPYYVGGGVGMSYTGPSITVNNSYAMRECMRNYLGEYASHNGNSDKVKFTGGTIPVLQRYLTGTDAYEWTNLNFDKYWSVRPDGCPVLTSFYDGEKVSTDGLEKAFSFDWFDAEAGGGTIYDRADFIGFTMLSWTTKFEEQTVRLGADITLNTGDASSWGGSDPYWQLIPMSTFGGTFDGQGHTVSGVFARQEASVGLFGRTAKTAVIQNLRLVNSFYDVLGFGENHFGIAGSIVGQGGGTLRNIYSNATLRTKGISTAGIIGRLNLDETANRLESLWFDGVIDAVDEEFGYTDGGIAGQALLGQSYISHCLFTGTINSAVSSKGAKVGGILASTENKCFVDIYDCLSAGTLNCGNPYYKGAIMGTMYTNNTVNIRNCYADSLVALGNAGQFVSAAKNAAVKDGELNGAAIPLAAAKLIGVNGYRWTTLDFDNYWAARSGACPAPKSLVGSPLDTSSAQKMVDTGWYDEDAATLVVDSLADLYGLQVLSTGTDFAGKTVKLGADITLNTGDASAWGDKAPENTWTGISSFAGTLDGQGHTISGLYLDGGASEGAALIGALQGGTVKNLRLRNSYVVNAGSDTASVAGRCFGGTLENVYSDAVVTSPKAVCLGGLIASVRGANTVTMRNCQFDGEVLCTSETNGGQVGGLCAVIVNADSVLEIENCLMSGKVDSTAMMAVGGATASTFQTGATLRVKDTLISGPVTSKGGGSTGGVIGNASEMQVSLANVYCVGAAIGQGTPASGVAQSMTRATLLGGQGYQNTLLDFTAKPYWVAVEGETPLLKEFYSGSAMDVSKLLRPDTSWYSDSEDSFVITNLSQLMGFANLSATHDFAGKTVKLGADIDVNPDWTASDEAPAQPWPMIGSQNCMFQGTFDGQGHTVRGVYVDSDVLGIGFFSWINNGAVVKNFTLANSFISSTREDASGISRVGAIVGDSHTLGSGGAISGVTVGSDVTVRAGGSQAGGILGGAMGAVSITDCSFAGTVSGGNQVGGIAGAALNNGAVTIADCTFTGTAVGANGVGGVLGRCERGAQAPVTVSGCTVSGKVDGAQNVGGVLGEFNSSENAVAAITGCASSAAITVSGAPARGGGVVGYATRGILTVSGCTFDGSVEQSGLLAGGIVAQVGGAAVTIDECLSTGTLTSGGMTGTVLGYVSSGSAGIKESIGLNTNSAVRVCSGSGAAGSYTVDNAVSLPAGNNDASAAQTYVISTAEKLALIAELSDRSGFGGITLQLAEDIDLNPGWTASAEAPETPWHMMNTVYPFKGTLDGQGHTLSGLYVNAAKNGDGASNGGLISVLGAGTVKDLKLRNAYITGDGTEIGSVAGQSFGGTLEKVYSDATVTTSAGRRLGGLVGAAHGSAATTLRACQFDGTVRQETSANGGELGGLVGALVNGDTVLTAEHCLMSGTVSVDTMMAVGGVTAAALQAGATVNIFDTLISGTVTSGGGGQTGAFIGKAADAKAQITKSYATAESCTLGTNGIGTTGAGVTNNGAVLAAAELTGSNAVKNSKLNFASYWGAVESGTPVLLAFYDGETLDVSGVAHADTEWYDDSQDSFVITTASQLLGFAELSKTESFAGKTVKLGADIDLNPDWTASDTEPDVVWPMVGQQSNKFQGTFDGQGHTVRGVYVRSDTMGAGFFSWIDNGAAVKDFTLANSRIVSEYKGSGISRVGAVVGDTHVAGSGGVITGVTVAADTAVQAAAGQAGGIVGGAMGALTVENCRMDGTVTGQGVDVGGILGVCMNSGAVQIADNVVTGTVTCHDAQAGGVVGRIAKAGVIISGNTVSGTVTGVMYTGGVAGFIGAANCTISACTVSGTVTSTKDDINTMGATGGVAGLQKGSNLMITGCRVTGTVYSAGAFEAGGIVGSFSANGTVEKCYCSATVIVATKAQNVGGILGAVREANTTATVSQTEFAGTVTKADNQPGGGGQLGGIAAKVMLSTNTLNVTDCLMSGTVITDKMMGVGGIVVSCEQTGAKCSITRTLITGKVESAGGGQTGAVVGNANAMQLTMTDVYAVSGVCSMGTNGVGQGTATGTLTVLTAAQLQGDNAKTNAPALDYTAVWTTVDGAVPALRALAQ